MSTLRAVMLMVSLGSLPAFAAELFPWADAGEQRLESSAGPLNWKVTRGDTEFKIEGHSPQWSVVHRCALDGTPIETEKTVGKRKTRLRWTKDGVEFTWDVNTKTAPKMISEKGLWDGDTLDARLPGLALKKGKEVEFRIVDTDKDDASVVPMGAELDGEAKCGAVACRHVTMRYTGVGAIFVAKWHYHFGTGADAKYLKYEHEKESYAAK